MIITKLRINNYKSIEDMALEFVKGKNIIVGQNNSGKSNIISAINLVIGEKWPSKRYEDNFYYQDSDSFTISLQLSECSEFDTNYLENYGKKTALCKLTPDLAYLKMSPDEIDELGIAIKTDWVLSTDLISLIENAKNMYITLHSKKGEDAIYTLSMILDDGYLYKFKYFSQELLTSFITSAIIPSERNIKNELAVNNYSWYGKLIKKVWQEMSDEDKEKLNENNINLSEVTNSIFEGLTSELGDSVKDAIPYNKLEFKLIQDTKTDYYKGIKILLDDGYYSLLDDKGSGIKSLIIIELFKLYCKKYHKFSSCLIVEEPEVFLHPQARSVLSKKIDQFLLENSNQTIVTTHSEQFLSNFDIKQLTFINKEDNKSVKYKIIDSDFTERDFQKMNIITKTDNAEMYFANSVILVEGGEKYIIRKLIDLYKDELFLDYNNCSLIKVGGKSYFGIYKKMLEKLGKKVYIIGDYDNLKEEINEYLPQTLLEKLNTIKSVTGGLKAFSEYSTEQQEELEEIFKYLKDNNIYILHNGALEDYYNKQEIDRLKQENSLGKAKEVVAHYISTILTADNINNLLVIDNDFKDYVMDIINCISDNSNVITMNDDDIYDDLD
jgi:predicted ATP-dependent endonuclease of OLD family